MQVEKLILTRQRSLIPRAIALSSLPLPNKPQKRNYTKDDRYQSRTKQIKFASYNPKLAIASQRLNVNASLAKLKFIIVFSHLFSLKLVIYQK